ncbi:MAG: hypothetical protein KIT58_17290 [Planctomycetota bacterium]|nr:hypothetical protein [Planctomycetota bacterium]
MSSPRQNRFRRHRGKILAALLAVGFVGVDLALGTLREALFTRRVRQANDHVFRTKDRELHHAFVPGASVPDARWGSLTFPFHVNSLGFRDTAPREVAPVTSGRRVVFLGDSFTEGLGVRAEDTFVGKIAEAAGAHGVEVLNAGCSSYAPSIYLASARRMLARGLRFERLVVCIDISDIDDEAHYYATNPEGRVVRPKREGLARLGNWLRKHSLVYQVAAFGWSGSPPQVGQARGRWTIDEALLAAWGRAGLAQATARMTDLAALLREHGVALTVVVYPWPDQIVARDLDSLQVRHWRAWAEEHGARFVDLFGEFITDEPAEAVLAECFIPGDVHWNEAGHARIARGFLAEHPLDAR